MFEQNSSQRFKDEIMLRDFLERWPIDNLSKMSLRHYNHVGDRDTFCQDVETKTRLLASIKGNSSAKFGIYRQLNKASRPPGTVSNELYTWETKFNSKDLDENIAFKKVMEEVQHIANFAMAGDFESIEALNINPLFRWKVAFLYSQNRLIPIFATTKLRILVNLQGMDANRHTSYYAMQKYLIERKPFDMTPVEYMRKLFGLIRIGSKEENKESPLKGNRRRRRIGQKQGGEQQRKGHLGYTANLFHDDIQQALYKQLCSEYGGDCVSMEEDWVDICVKLSDKILLYEVKSDRYASDCMLKGIGQALGYAYRMKEYHGKEIELIIASPNEQTESEHDVIDFLRRQIVLPISYLKIVYNPFDI